MRPHTSIQFGCSLLLMHMQSCPEDPKPSSTNLNISVHSQCNTQHLVNGMCIAFAAQLKIVVALVCTDALIDTLQSPVFADSDCLADPHCCSGLHPHVQMYAPHHHVAHV